MKQKESNWATKGGILVLIVSIPAASYFQMPYLRIFLILLLFLCLASMLWAGKALSAVEVSVEGRGKADRTALFPGGKTELEIRLKNQSLLPIVWLKLLLPSGEKKLLAFADGGEEQAFAWIMPGQEISYQQEIQALRRGIFSPDRIEISSGDGFGLKESKRSFQPKRLPSIVIFPLLFPVQPRLLIRKMNELEEARSGIYKDPTLIRTVRDYELHDNAKDINWRQLAREGKLSVNVREEEDYRRLSLFLDLESFVYEEESFDADGTLRKKRRLEEEGMERMLSLAGSLIRALSEKEIHCSLVIPAYAGKESRLLLAGKRERRADAMLTALAEIDYQGEETELPLKELAEKRHALGPVFFIAAKESCRSEALKKEKRLPSYFLLRETEVEKKDRREIAWREVICHES